MKLFLKFLKILVLVFVVMIGGLIAAGYLLERSRQRDAVKIGTEALQANDPAKAMVYLEAAAKYFPNDTSVAYLYQESQEKWLESVDQAIAGKTALQRYVMFSTYPWSGERTHLAEPLASAHERFIARNAEEAQVELRGIVERAIDLIQDGQFATAEEEMKRLRVGGAVPDLPELRAIYDRAYDAQLLIRAGDLAQNEQIPAARKLLDYLRPRPTVTREAFASAAFRVDLGDFNLHLNQAIIAAAKGDTAKAEAVLVESRQILGRLFNREELARLFPDLPEADRGTALFNELRKTEYVIHTVIGAPAAH